MDRKTFLLPYIQESFALSGLLKPSTVLGKGAGSGKHDVMWDPVVTSSSSSSSELGQDTIGTTLPSVELPTPQFSLPPPDSSSKGIYK